MTSDDPVATSVPNGEERTLAKSEQSVSGKEIPQSRSAERRGDSVEACVKRYLVFRFLSGHPDQPLILKVARTFCLLVLSCLLAKGLLFLFNDVLFSDRIISADALKEINKRLSAATTSGNDQAVNASALPIIALSYYEDNAKEHEALRASISANSGDKDAKTYNIVARDLTNVPFFWPMTTVSSEISLEALVKCYELYASQPHPGAVTPSEDVLNKCLKSLRNVLVPTKDVEVANESGKGEETEKPSIGLGYIDDAFGKIALQRRINGYIQFFSIWGFSMFLVLAAARWLAVLQFQTSLLRTKYISKIREDSSATPWVLLQEALDKLAETKDPVEYERIFQERAKDLAIGYDAINENLRERRCFSAHVSLMRQALVASLTDTSIAANIPTFVSTQASILSGLAYEGCTLLRFLVWVVPTIGFVGTVFGISHTLQITSVLDSYDEFVRISGKSVVNTAIAVAFDSTFISLVMSIIAMLWQQTAGGHEEEIIQSQADECISTIVAAASAKAPTRPLPPTPSAFMDVEKILEAIKGLGGKPSDVSTPTGSSATVSAPVEDTRAASTPTGKTEKKLPKTKRTGSEYFVTFSRAAIFVLIIVALLYVMLWKHFLSL